MKLTLDQVLRWGVDRQYLGATKATDPVAVARRLSGVHAQVAASACPPSTCVRGPPSPRRRLTLCCTTNEG